LYVKEFLTVGTSVV